MSAGYSTVHASPVAAEAVFAPEPAGASGLHSAIASEWIFTGPFAVHFWS